MNKDLVKSIASEIFEYRDKNGCWNVLAPGEKRYPEFNYYVPKYKATIWVLIQLADMQYKPVGNEVAAPLDIISHHFYDKSAGIYSLGKSHYPIPCLNGNMLYLHQFFNHDPQDMSGRVVDFFTKYQRFDDGNFKTPSSFPYYSNRSCYGYHTCYWGVVKLFKGLSFIPENKRSKNAQTLMRRCIEFILLHEVCFSSHSPPSFIHKSIQHLTFPNMYNSDFLEILWLLKREKVKSGKMAKALALLKSKMKPDLTWEIERRIRELIIPIGKRNGGNFFITERARSVAEYYGI